MGNISSIMTKDMGVKCKGHRFAYLIILIIMPLPLGTGGIMFLGCLFGAKPLPKPILAYCQ